MTVHNRKELKIAKMSTTGKNDLLNYSVKQYCVPIKKNEIQMCAINGKTMVRQQTQSMCLLSFPQNPLK
jgi:hypothetical protein